MENLGTHHYVTDPKKMGRTIKPGARMQTRNIMSLKANRLRILYKDTVAVITPRPAYAIGYTYMPEGRFYSVTVTAHFDTVSGSRIMAV